MDFLVAFICFKFQMDLDTTDHSESSESASEEERDDFHLDINITATQMIKLSLDPYRCIKATSIERLKLTVMKGTTLEALLQNQLHQQQLM